MLVGDGHVPVNGRGAIEGAEHAGSKVRARDAEAAGQVAVGRGTPGSPGWLAGQRRRAEDRPVQVAGMSDDLELIAGFLRRTADAGRSASLQLDHPGP
jgi:hypothetical protein